VRIEGCRNVVATRLILALMLCVSPGLACAEASAPSIPDTPAGHVLAAWLDAFNSGNVATFESFKTSHAPWLNTDGEMARRSRTGGYDLVSINQSGRLWLTFRVKEKSSPAEVTGNLVVRSNDLDHMSLLSLAPVGTKSGEFSVDDPERTSVIEGLARLLNEFYVFPDIARKVSANLVTQQKRGDYSGITDGEVLAVRLDDDLAALSGDKHLAVDFFVKAMPPEGPPARPRSDPRRLAASNCGFETAEHFPPNIGYLKLNEFAEPEGCASTAIAAMTFLADSDALIIDLRDNHGGAPGMVAVICSYLFDASTHLDDIYERKENATDQLWTLPYVPGKKFTEKPVFVLTSARTFSAAEEFSYDLQSLKRATVIGEATGGGAHTVAPHRIDDHFYIRVPFGRFINPITKTDWEGTGVEPDVRISALDALDEALKRARGQIASERSPR
jgi:Peptidase family S41/N-terminal domain of Peptidase_S41 in eukaryotic IRBP